MIRQLLIHHPLPGGMAICLVLAAASGHPARADEPPGEARASVRALAQSDERGGLADAFARARSGFRQPASGELAQARQAVDEAAGDLARTLDEVPTGSIASRQLELDRLAQQLSADQPDVDQLDAVLHALRVNRPALAAGGIGRLRFVLRQWMGELRASHTSQDEYLRRLEQLEQSWLQYADSGSPEALAGVHAAAGWLADHGQAPRLLAELRPEVSRPNHIMRISGRYIETALVRPVNQPLVSNETIDGAQVRVRGTIEGTVSAALQPHATMGAVQVHFDGVGKSKITVRKGPATIWARGLTQVGVTETVYFSERGVRLGEPAVRVTNSANPYAADLDIKCRLLRKVAVKLILRIAWRKKAESDREGSRRAKEQVEQQIAGQGRTLVGELNRSISEFAMPALGGPEPASQIGIRTTAEYLEYSARHAYSWQFAAPTPPPVPDTSQPAILVQAHESALNNSSVALAGRRVAEPDFREVAFESFGLVPIDDAAVEGRIPGAITFADREPVAVHLSDGLARVTLRLESFESGGHVYNGGPWTVRAAYRPVVGREVALVREGPITIEGAGGEAAAALEELLGHLMVSRARQEGISLGELARSQQLDLGELSLEHGWLTLAFRQLPKGSPTRIVSARGQR